jgi:hypothetical protein
VSFTHITNDPPVDIERGLKRRNRELVKPFLQLFHSVGPQVKQEIVSTLDYFLKAKQHKKENTLEAAFCPIIKELLSDRRFQNDLSEHDNNPYMRQIWGCKKTY